MTTETTIWLILFLPLSAFIINGLIIRPFLNRYSSTSGIITVLAIGTSFVLSLTVLSNMIMGGTDFSNEPVLWLQIDEFSLTIGILLNELTAIMLVVVTGVSLLIQIYSIGYMNGGPEDSEFGKSVYARYFGYMSLFTASMLGLVIASNIIQLFVFWELVGLSSYLLIGFWFERPAAAAAAKKAFIVTRVGDLGFLIGIMYLFAQAGSFPIGSNPLDIRDINTHLPALVSAGIIGGTTLTLITLGIFAGAIGKSGQFPLHTWLPDAMEGPTPVSALIHAATMVTAGVFLVARFFPLFEASQDSLNTVAIVGGFTAIFAATMALVTNDIKRVLAYSTVSQLGYMMLALGIGAYGPAIFHLFTHAFFKALLFLGAGSVNHATGTFDMRYMGGLRKAMPWTYATFLIGSLSLAGIFPLAGFWSKDEILAQALGNPAMISQIVFWLALSAVFMTGFYMFRALIMTFEGDFRGGTVNDLEGQEGHDTRRHESPVIMVLPMVILAFFSICIGYLVNPISDMGPIEAHWLTGHFLHHGLDHGKSVGFNFTLALGSSAIAAAGILLAILMYRSKPIIATVKPTSWFKPMHMLLYRKYFFDEIYEDIITRRIFYRGLACSIDWVDKSIIDRVVNCIGWIGINIGGALREAQTGQLQIYASVISAGILLITGIYLFIM